MNRRETTTSARTGAVNSTHAPACAMTRHTHMPSAQAHQAGFTIVEVMVAVVVFAVGLLAIAGMQTQSISQSTLSDQMSLRVNAITHQAETLIRLPVKADTTNNVEVNPIFEEANMCGYGEDCDGNGGKYCDEYCDGSGWDELASTDKKPHALCQRVTQGYPLPNLVMIELATIPKGVTTKKAEQRMIRIANIRSLRWN